MHFMGIPSALLDGLPRPSRRFSHAPLPRLSRVCAYAPALRVFSKYSSLTLSIATLIITDLSTLSITTPTLITPYSLYSFLSSLF